MNKNGKIFVALLAGAAAGAAAGLLFAPEKGKDTRKKIADSAKKMGEESYNFTFSDWDILDTADEN